VVLKIRSVQNDSSYLKDPGSEYKLKCLFLYPPEFIDLVTIRAL